MRAVILAGGLGLRLRPLTNDTPKIMVRILGRPIGEYLVEWLRENSFRSITFAAGYKWQRIHEYFRDGSHLGVYIDYSVEEEPLGDGGAVKHFLSSSNPGVGGDFLVVNGDMITDIDLKPILSYHLGKRRRGGLATVAVANVQYPYGVAEVDGEGRVLEFLEKPTLPVWTNTGIIFLAKECYPYLPEKGNLSEVTLPLLAERDLLYAYRVRSSFWRAVDDMKSLERIEKELKSSQLSLTWTGGGTHRAEARLST